MSYAALDEFLRNLAVKNHEARVAREREWELRRVAEEAAEADDDAERERTYAAWQDAILVSSPASNAAFQAAVIANGELSRLLQAHEDSLS